MTYTCATCQNTIPENEMTEHRKRRRRIVCTSCKSNKKREYDAIRYSRNSDEVIRRVREYTKNNESAVKARCKKYRSMRVEYMKSYLKEYREIYKPRRNAKEKEKLANDPLYALKKRLRNNLLVYVKKAGRKKQCSTSELLGCSFEEFKAYFESKFSEGMTWELFCNGGSIHIDHIIPVDAFNLLNADELKKCFHYTNLQPLWKEDNLKKSNKMPESTDQ